MKSARKSVRAEWAKCIWLRTQHSLSKAEIGNWVRDIRDQKVKLTYSLTRDGAADFGDIVVIYYKTPMVYEYPDGRIVDRDKVFKFTHT